MHFLTLTLHPSIDRLVEVERWIAGGTFGARLRGVVPAGKGINTARTLRGLLGPKERIQAAAWIGRQESAFFAEALASERIGFLPIPRACLTRTCWTVFEREPGREEHVKESMPPPSRSEERALLACCARLPLAGACVAVCGSAPAGTSPRTLRALFALLRSRANVLIADTNGPCLEAAGRAGLDGLKGNAEEMGAWLGLDRALDPEQSAHRRRLMQALAVKIHNPISAFRKHSGAPRRILVTLGADGALLADASGLWLARPPCLRGLVPRSAVGCGDAATAGWMWALAGEDAACASVCRAVACGTAKLANADPGGLDRNLVRRMLRATHAKRLT